MRSEWGRARKIILKYHPELEKERKEWDYKTASYIRREPPINSWFYRPKAKVLQRMIGTYFTPPERGKSPEEFTISVSPIDIVFAGRSRHYISCLDIRHGGSYYYLKSYLKNPNCAIVYVRDKKTKEFMSRTFIHLATIEGQDAILIEQIYGSNFPLQFFYEKMREFGFKVATIDYDVLTVHQRNNNRYFEYEVRQPIFLNKGFIGSSGYYLEGTGYVDSTSGYELR